MTAAAIPDEFLAATVREKLQYHRLRPAILRDQHAREWSCQLSTETLEPATPCTPVGWTAPHPYLVPPAKYQRQGRSFGTLEIDYDGWLRDIHQARREYEEQVMEWARKLYGGAALQAIKNRDADLRRMAGPGPMSPEFVRAMKSGASKWALGIKHPSGMTYPTPAWAASELDTLQVYETWDGSDVDTAVDAARYADEEPDLGWADDEAQETDAAAVAAEAARYGDAAPELAPAPAPVAAAARPRGRPRKR